VKISHIKPYWKMLPGQLKVCPKVIEIDQKGEEQYKVEYIATSQLKGRKLEYLIYWAGYNKLNHTWELADIVNTIPKAVAKFHKKNPSGPRKLHGLSTADFQLLFSLYKYYTNPKPS
ncbi:hypothetical protein J3R82DRAFT_3823, partial [Butyriboletus roseoflavus]